MLGGSGANREKVVVVVVVVIVVVVVVVDEDDDGDDDDDDDSCFGSDGGCDWHTKLFAERNFQKIFFSCLCNEHC